MRNAKIMVQEVFEQYDESKNGLLEKHEFAKWFEDAKASNAPILTAFRAHEASPDDIDLTFRFVDKDNDGSVERVELLHYFALFKMQAVYPERGARLEQAEIAVENLWPELDEDGDGVIDKDEFRRWFDPRVEELTAITEYASFDLSNFDTVFGRADSNSNGTIDKREMVDLLVWVQEADDKKIVTDKARAKVKEIFDYYDADKDGSIDRAEFKNILYYYYYDLQKIKDINVDNEEEAFDYIDKDSDGLISDAEFVELYVKIYEKEKRASL